MNTISKLLMSLAVLCSPVALASQPAVPATADSRIQTNPPDGEVPGLPRPEPEDGWSGDPRRTVLSLEPLPVLTGVAMSLAAPGNTFIMVPLGLEYAVHPNASVSFSLAPLYLELPQVSAAGVDASGGVRVYPFGRAPDGLWLGAQAGATLVQSGTSGGVAFDLQPRIGYQWVNRNGLTIGVGASLSLASMASGDFPLSLQVPIGFAW
jgi:hypothetical protein